MKKPSVKHIVLGVAAVAALVATFACGMLVQEIADEGGWVALAGHLAQIVPEVHDYEATPDIPPATNLTPLKTFWKARQRVINNYVYPDKINEVELTYGAIKGMLAALGDPYTRFMTPDEYAEFQTESEGHFEGIGAVLSQQQNEETGENEVVITSVLPEGPASETDLQAGDIIVRVDKKPIRQLRLDQVVKLIRGPGGTKVVLSVSRKDVEHLVDIEITRGRVDFPIVEARMLEGDIGYLWLRSFNRQAEMEVRDKLDFLKSKGMKGLVFDLSSDPGGMLDQAVAVASLFLDNTPITWIKDRNKEAEPLQAHSGIMLAEDIPIVVLIDSASASASEIVAGALQDTGRATIVGHPSFGKGKVQTVMELDDGSALVLTTAVYLTPNKRDISREELRGVQPDVRFPDMPKGMTGKEWEAQWHPDQIKQAVKVLRKKMAAAAG